MSRILTMLGRLAFILLGYCAASLAGSLILNLVFLAATGIADELPAVISAGSLIFSIPFIALFVAYFAFLPAIPVILAAEILGKKDWLFYALGGGLIALVVIGYFGLSLEQGIVFANGIAAGAILAGGLGGGLTYWIIAGRLAGNWRH